VRICAYECADSVWNDIVKAHYSKHCVLVVVQLVIQCWTQLRKQKSIKHIHE
jgi:hypothetical protein